LDGELHQLFGLRRILAGDWALKSNTRKLYQRNFSWGWQSNRYAAIKINDCRYVSKEAARHELDISNRISGANPDHRGHVILRTVIDSFEVVSPNGSHLCSIFEPMREPLWLFRRRFGADKVTQPFLPVLKTYIQILLEGLDYLHSECHIIHTG